MEANPVGGRDARTAQAGVGPTAPRLRQRREALRLTQAELAEALGVTANTVARWERGEQRIGQPERVEHVLGALEAGQHRRGAAAGEPLPFRRGRRTAAPATLAAPPEPTVERRQAVLAVELNSFIGRERDLGEVIHLVRTNRLVTLTGAGGVGKTRLALHAAQAIGEATFSDGVYLVEISEITDSRLVAQAVASALRLRLAPGRSPLQALTTAIGQRALLLVLDSCEQLVMACAELVQAVLSACGGVTILATSRQPLDVASEVVWSVPPLEVPDAGVPQLEQVQLSAAAQLLVERIRTRDTSFRLTAQTAPAVVEICRRLDGLPLALELAAARVPQLGVNQVAARLDNRFRLLTLTVGNAPARQQTLRATLEFDEELLDDDERRLLRRLAVFAGGFDLEAAEAVGGGQGTAAEGVLDQLGGLVDRALVIVQHRNGDVRYRQLETVRHFCLEQLTSSPPEAAATRDRHAAFYAALVQNQPRMVQLGPEAAPILARFDAEQHNLRAALGWLVERRALPQAQELALAMAPWWAGRGYLDEGRDWMSQLLAMPGAADPSSTRAGLLAWAALLANFSGDWMKVRPLAQAALDNARAVGDGVHAVAALQQLAWNSLGMGNRTAARALFEEAADTSQAIADAELEITSRVFLALLLLGGGEVRQAQTEAELALDLSRKHALTHEMGRIQLALGLLALERRDAASARRRLEAAVQRLQSGANLFWEAAALTALGRTAAELGDAQAAHEALAAGLKVGHRLGGRWPLLRSWLEACAVVAAARRRPMQALRLAAAASALMPHPGAQPVVLQGLSDRWLADLRAAVGQAAERVWADGHDMPTEDAVAEALGGGTESADSDTQAARELTRRERDVVRLVALGHSNREIGAQLVITEGTARVHVERLMAKLTVHSRAQLVVWALGHGLGQTADWTR